MTNPLSSQRPWDLIAEGYNADTAVSLAYYSANALEQLKPGPQERLLDIACGPGTLAMQASAQVQSIDAIDFSPEMLEQLRNNVQERKITNIRIHEMDGQALEFEDNSFDIVTSMFGMMFFPDRIGALREAFRVLRPGGRCVVSSWPPMQRGSFMASLMQAIHSISDNPPVSEDVIRGWDSTEVLQSEMKSAGFSGIQTRTVVQPIEIDSVEKMWKSAVRGNVMVALLKEGLADQWPERSAQAIQFLKNTLPELPHQFDLPALITTARKN